MIISAEDLIREIRSGAHEAEQKHAYETSALAYLRITGIANHKQFESIIELLVRYNLAGMVFRLDIRGNQLSQVPSLKSLYNLRQVDARNNPGLESLLANPQCTVLIDPIVPIDLVPCFEAAKLLDHIEQWTPQFLQENPSFLHLKITDVDNDTLEKILDRCIAKGLHQYLVGLDFSDGYLKKLPQYRKIIQFPELRTLNLSGCGLRKMGGAYHIPRCIIITDKEKAPVKYVSKVYKAADFIKKFDQIPSSDLDSVTLEHINDAQFRQILRLFIEHGVHQIIKRLDVHDRFRGTPETMYNDLTECPDLIGAFTALEVLVFNYNKLKTLSPHIGELKNLIELRVAGNQLTSVPIQIGFCKNLERVDFSSNQLREIPIGLLVLPVLGTLCMAHNRLRVLLPGQISASHYYQQNDQGYAICGDGGEENAPTRTLARYCRNEAAAIADIIQNKGWKHGEFDAALSDVIAVLKCSPVEASLVLEYVNRAPTPADPASREALIWSRKFARSSNQRAALSPELNTPVQKSVAKILEESPALNVPAVEDIRAFAMANNIQPRKRDVVNPDVADDGGSDPAQTKVAVFKQR